MIPLFTHTIMTPSGQTSTSTLTLPRCGCSPCNAQQLHISEFTNSSSLIEQSQFPPKKHQAYQTTL